MESRIRSNCYSFSYSVPHYSARLCQKVSSPHPKTLREAGTDGWSNEFREGPLGSATFRHVPVHQLLEPRSLKPLKTLRHDVHQCPPNITSGSHRNSQGTDLRPHNDSDGQIQTAIVLDTVAGAKHNVGNALFNSQAGGKIHHGRTACMDG